MTDEPGLQLRPAPHLGHEQHAEQQRRVQPGAEQERDEVRGRVGAVAPERDLDRGRGDAGGADQCGGGRENGAREGDQRARVGLAPRVGLRDGEHERGDAAGEQRAAEHVRPPPAAARGPRAAGPRPTRATMPSGTLMQNSARQPNASTRTPPSAGPATAATDADAAHRPIAPGRRSGGVSASTNASDAGSSIAAPTPCTPRAASSRPNVGATAASSDAAVKTPTPAANRRPAADQVGEPPGGSQQRREQDRVERHDPRQRGHADAEVAGEVGDRQVRDRDVEEGEEGGAAGEQQRRARGGHALEISDRTFVKSIATDRSLTC